MSITEETINKHEGNRTKGFIFTGTNKQVVEDYVFIVNSYFPENETETATERLCKAIQPQLLCTLAKLQPHMLPSPRKCHAATGAGRR